MLDKRAVNEDRAKQIADVCSDPVRHQEMVAGAWELGPRYPKLISERLVGVDEVCCCPKCGKYNIHDHKKGVWWWEPCKCDVKIKGVSIVWGQLVPIDEKREDSHGYR